MAYFLGCRILTISTASGASICGFNFRKYPALANPLKWVGKLRSYQEVAVNAFFGVKRGILAAATGSGKSIMITNTVARLIVEKIGSLKDILLKYQSEEEKVELKKEISELRFGDKQRRVGVKLAERIIEFIY